MGNAPILLTEPLRADRRDRLVVRRFRITVEDGPDRGMTVVSDGDRLVVGTDETAGLRLTDRTVSRFHCELVLTPEAVQLADLGSRNGTSIDTVPVRSAPLRDGASIGIGSSRLVFSLEQDHATIPLSTTNRFGRLLGGDPAMRAVMAQLARAASTNTTVLLQGDTGTGKELAAESLHTESARRDAPFLVIDCGAVPPDLLEDQLFGHDKGAFTSAEAQRVGIFEAANGGTVMLDEIGELPLALQPKLLRVLESREIRRIGATGHVPVDVRIIAATNRDLRAEVNAQRFRPDLYFRIAVLEIRLPPLRERADDLPMLVDAILDDLGLAQHPVAATLRTADARAQLARHSWPGNVRELRNYVERCVAMRAPMPPDAPGDAEVMPAEGTNEPLKTVRDRAVRIVERAYLVDVLARHEGNVSAAARAAGMDRVQFYRLLWRHGLK